MNAPARHNAFYAGVAALLMLVYGFSAGMEAGVDHGPLYAFSFDLFNAMLKIGGLGLLAVATICFLGRRAGLLLDAIVSKLCGLIMVACGVCWTAYEGGIDTINVLVLIFGALFIRSAITNWRLYAAARPAVSPPASPPAPNTPNAPRAQNAPIAPNVLNTKNEPDAEKGWFRGAVLRPPPTEAPEPVHPASVRSEALPAEGEPPPAEGYLAALAREKEEPPTAASD